VSIKWPIAKTCRDDYVLIKDAVRGAEYHRPEGSGLFVPRMGQQIRWHFAHRPGVVCTGGGSRHSVAKHYIASVLKGQVSLPFGCGCSGLATRPYRIKFSDVRVEANVQEYRIDVIARRNQQLLCVEVVDSHLTEPEKKEALADTLVEVTINNLSNDEIFYGQSVQDRLLQAIEFHLLNYLTRHQHAFFIRGRNHAIAARD
jgi:hypothetical protein